MGRPYNGEGAASSATSTALSVPGLVASNPLLLPTAPVPLKPSVVGLAGMTTSAMMMQV